LRLMKNQCVKPRPSGPSHTNHTDLEARTGPHRRSRSSDCLSASWLWSLAAAAPRPKN